MDHHRPTYHHRLLARPDEEIVDADGHVRFTSIFPACYTGRWPHIHFEVYPDRASITDAAKAIATSQVALPKNICDKVYAEPGYERSVSTLAQLSLGTDALAVGVS